MIYNIYDCTICGDIDYVRSFRFNKSVTVFREKPCLSDMFTLMKG